MLPSQASLTLRIPRRLRCAGTAVRGSYVAIEGGRTLVAGGASGQAAGCRFPRHPFGSSHRDGQKSGTFLGFFLYRPSAPWVRIRPWANESVAVMDRQRHTGVRQGIHRQPTWMAGCCLPYGKGRFPPFVGVRAASVHAGPRVADEMSVRSHGWLCMAWTRERPGHALSFRAGQEKGRVARAHRHE